MNTDLLKPELRRIMEYHQGRKNAITRRELREALQLPNSQDRKLRLTIAEIRREGTPVLFSTQPPSGYYLPESLAELKEGIAHLRSYVIDEARTLRDLRLAGNRWIAGEGQGKLL